MGSTRDVEPLEFLLHQDHAFLFPPGGTTTVPAGAPGAGSTVQRGAHSTSGASHVHGHTRDMPAPPPIGAYSTNGFALVGLALAGGLSDWARLRLRRTASPHTSSPCTGALGLADWRTETSGVAGATGGAFVALLLLPARAQGALPRATR